MFSSLRNIHLAFGDLPFNTPVPQEFVQPQTAQTQTQTQHATQTQSPQLQNPPAPNVVQMPQPSK